MAVCALSARVCVFWPTHTVARWTHLLELAYAYLLIPFVANPIGPLPVTF